MPAQQQAVDATVKCVSSRSAPGCTVLGEEVGVNLGTSATVKTETHAVVRIEKSDSGLVGRMA